MSLKKKKKKKKNSKASYKTNFQQHHSKDSQTYQFKDEPPKGLLIQWRAYDLDSVESSIAFLQVPLVKANALKQGVMSIGNSFQNHGERMERVLGTLLTWTSNKKSLAGVRNSLQAGTSSTLEDVKIIKEMEGDQWIDVIEKVTGSNRVCTKSGTGYISGEYIITTSKASIIYVLAQLFISEPMLRNLLHSSNILTNNQIFLFLLDIL